MHKNGNAQTSQLQILLNFALSGDTFWSCTTTEFQGQSKNKEIFFIFVDLFNCFNRLITFRLFCIYFYKHVWNTKAKE